MFFMRLVAMMVCAAPLNFRRYVDFSFSTVPGMACLLALSFIHSCAITPADAGGRWARSAAPIWKRSWTAAAPSDRGGGGETVVNVTAREFASRPAAWDLQRPALHFVNCSLTQHPGLGLGAGARRPPPLPPASAPRESLGSRFGFPAPHGGRSTTSTRTTAFLALLVLLALAALASVGRNNPVLLRFFSFSRNCTERFARILDSVEEVSVHVKLVRVLYFANVIRAE